MEATGKQQKIYTREYEKGQGIQIRSQWKCHTKNPHWRN